MRAIIIRDRKRCTTGGGRLMAFGATIAQELANTVLVDAAFVENGLVLQETEGIYNNFGEYQAGSTIETDVIFVQAPISGHDRLVLEEGLRDEDLRTFWIRGDFVALRYGATEGDQFLQGRVGPPAHTFTGTTQHGAELARDAYGSTHPDWLTLYWADPALLIKLTGFGSVLYQNYEPIEGHWTNSTVYRVQRASRWGAFTEVLGIRRNPGNLNVG